MKSIIYVYILAPIFFILILNILHQFLLKTYLKSFLKNKPKLTKFIYYLKKLKLIFIDFIFKNLFVILAIIIFIVLSLHFLTFLVICQKGFPLYFDPIPYTARYLNEFYIHRKTPGENVLKLCFAEAVAAVYANGVTQKSIGQNMPFDLKRVIGGECYRMAEEFADHLMQKNRRSPSKINIFLTHMFKKPVNSVYIVDTYKRFLIDFTARYGQDWYPKHSFDSEFRYFYSTFCVEELNPFFFGRSTFVKFHEFARLLKYFRFLEIDGVYFFVYTDEGRRLLRTFFDALARENPDVDYDYLFKTLEPNYKIKAKHILRLIYDIISEYENNISVFFSKLENLDNDNFRSGIEFINSYDNLHIMHPIYEQFIKEIVPAQKMIHILYYPGNSMGSEYLTSYLDRVENRLILNKTHGIYRSSGGFVHVDIIFGDVRLCRNVHRCLHWIGNAGYIKDKDTLLLYEYHAKIVMDLMVGGEDFAENYKLTFNEVMVSLNFVKNIVKTVKLEEEKLAKDIFDNIDIIRRKKRI